jgi:hypothetical protein
MRKSYLLSPKDIFLPSRFARQSALAQGSAGFQRAGRYRLRKKLAVEAKGHFNRATTAFAAVGVRLIKGGQPPWAMRILGGIGLEDRSSITISWYC